ncbi:MAG: hypothetical protein V7K92_26120 [Nostoc sp.]
MSISQLAIALHLPVELYLVLTRSALLKADSSCLLGNNESICR